MEIKSIGDDRKEITELWNITIVLEMFVRFLQILVHSGLHSDLSPSNSVISHLGVHKRRCGLGQP